MSQTNTSSAADTSKLVARPPLVMQILAIILFTGFAIPVSIIAMDQFGFLGLALTAFLAYQWVRVATLGSMIDPADAARILAPALPKLSKSSGNASFDSYRNELLDRLENEQHRFEGFVERLRDAKDRTQFDHFMTERENNMREVSQTRENPAPA